MSAIVIKGDKEINSLILSIAKKMGAYTTTLKEEQFEDLALGYLMDEEKTNELVSRELILEILENAN